MPERVVGSPRIQLEQQSVLGWNVIETKTYADKVSLAAEGLTWESGVIVDALAGDLVLQRDGGEGDHHPAYQNPPIKITGTVRQVQLPHLRNHQGRACREQFPGARIADPLQRALQKVCPLDSHSMGISVWIACHLAKNPVIMPSRRQHNGRAELGRRKIRERKPNKDYCAL